MELFYGFGSSLPAGQSLSLHVLLKDMAVYKITYFINVLDLRITLISTEAFLVKAALSDSIYLLMCSITM